MTYVTKLMGAAAALALSAGAALAEPALIFDLGGKFDKSFNEAAFNGAVRWAEETGEVTKDLVHVAEGRSSIHHLRGEIVQALAMLHRLMIEGDQVHGLPPRADLLSEDS